MPNPAEWGVIVTAAGAIGAALQKAWQSWTGRDVAAASAEKIREEAKQTAQVTAANEVDTLRGIIGDVRQAREEDRLEYARERAEQSEQIKNLVRRVTKLEERERHMLTRAAVHEAWDALAFQAIVNHDRTFPPPPPLAIENDPDQPQ